MGASRGTNAGRAVEGATGFEAGAFCALDTFGAGTDRAAPETGSLAIRCGADTFKAGDAAGDVVMTFDAGTVAIVTGFGVTGRGAATRTGFPAGLTAAGMGVVTRTVALAGLTATERGVAARAVAPAGFGVTGREAVARVDAGDFV